MQWFEVTVISSLGTFVRRVYTNDPVNAVYMAVQQLQQGRRGLIVYRTQVTDG